MIIKTHFLILTVFLFLNYSCKTQEQIQREEMVDSMSAQLMQNQKISAESNIELQEIKDGLTKLNGRMEELDHNSTTKSDETQKDMSERFTLLEATNKALGEEMLQVKEQLKGLNKKVDSQEKFIKTVLSSLKKMGAPKRSKGKRSTLDLALRDYKKGRYTKASKSFQKMLDSGSLKKSKRAHVIHNLGMSYYILAKNNKALLYFSKLFTEFPKSGFNKNGLYHLALTFKRLKKQDEYKQTLNELVSRFPKSKMAKKAKKLLK